MASFITTAPSTKIVSSDIRDLVNHPDAGPIDERSLFLWDMDETLTTTGHLGGIRWRNECRAAIAKLKEAKTIAKESPLFELLTLFIACSVTTKPAQEETPDLIKSIKEKGSTVIVVTARGAEGKNAWYSLTVSEVDKLTRKHFKDAEIDELPILFANNTSKERLVLSQFDNGRLDAAKFDKVFAAEDKMAGLEELENVAKALNMPFFGIHYTRVAEDEKSYDAKAVTLQFRALLNGGECPEENPDDEMLFEKTLIKVDQLLTDNDVYAQIKDSNVTEVYNKVRLAAANKLGV